MTNPSTTFVHHYNQMSWGPTSYYRSLTTGKRLAFRANEIAFVRPAVFGSGVVTTTGGYEFAVCSPKPESVS